MSTEVEVREGTKQTLTTAKCAPQWTTYPSVGVNKKTYRILSVISFSIVFFQLLGEELYRRGIPERFAKGYGFPAGHALLHVCILACDALLLIFAITMRDRRKT